MSETGNAANSGAVRRTSSGAITGDAAPAESFPIVVAPTHEQDFNTLRLRLVPLACWRTEDVNFAFASSFPMPNVTHGLVDLKELMDAHTDRRREPFRTPPLALFGHADPVGSDEFNKGLSGRRAEAIYALLIRDVAAWESLYGKDTWGDASVQEMLNHLGFDCGPADGKIGAKSQKALRDFQKSVGLAESGQNNAATRKKLYEKYMDAICIDGKGASWKLGKEHFLAQGKDSKGKGDFQGCGEFNPVLIFSKEDQRKFDQTADKTKRNEANAPNRRVMALLFRPGSVVDPAAWPCPRASEGTAGCRARFWSDHQARLANGEEQREFKKTKDTFACRFYQRVIDRSPCERLPPAPAGTGFLGVRVFHLGEPLRDLAVRFHRLNGRSTGEQVGPEIATDEEGFAIMRTPVPIGNYAAVVEGQRPKMVCTIFDRSEVEILVLPIGRPYLGIEGDVDFQSERQDVE